MLFIHFFEGDSPQRQEVVAAHGQSLIRNDQVTASCLTLGELYAGSSRLADGVKERTLRTKVAEMDLSLLPFDAAAIDIFATLRSELKIKAPDAINLACAGAASVDLFLTYDKQLIGLNVPGIKFIASPAMGLV